MEKYLSKEIIVLFIFILIGAIIGSLYDFFRAYRKVKKSTNKSVMIQDILFCFIAGFILLITIVYFLREQIRIYILASIVIGGVIYFSTLSSIMLKVFISIIKGFNETIYFIFLPLIVYGKLIRIMYAKVKKDVVKCCKYIKYVISYMYKFIKKDWKQCLKIKKKPKKKLKIK